MASKPKRSSRRGDNGPAAEPIQIIVRRGALRRYDKLAKDTAHLPVTLTWDRRLRERRTTSSDVPVDARKADRRKRPPFTWELADFVVIERPPQTDEEE